MTADKAIEILSYMGVEGNNPDEFDACNMGILAIQANTWIPVRERLPELHQKVLATYVTEDGANIAITYYDKYGFLIGEVTAWQPLPEPYNAESEE